jgi:hypothetical protein
MKKPQRNICISLRIKLFGIKNSNNNINKKNIFIIIEISLRDFLFFFNNLFKLNFVLNCSIKREEKILYIRVS